MEGTNLNVAGMAVELITYVHIKESVTSEIRNHAFGLRYR